MKNQIRGHTYIEALISVSTAFQRRNPKQFKYEMLKFINEMMSQITGPQLKHSYLDHAGTCAIPSQYDRNNIKETLNPSTNKKTCAIVFH